MTQSEHRASVLGVLVPALAAAAAVLLPVDCLGCGRDGLRLCDDCRARISPRPVSRTVPGVGRVVAGAAYSGPVRGALLALKEHGRTDALHRLAPLLAAAAREFDPGAGLPPGLVLLAVPSSRASRRRRGFDPVAGLVRDAGLRLGPPAALPWSAPLRLAAGRQQKRLGAAERAENLSGRMRAHPRLAGAEVVLVDDVVTTGATLAETARAIRAVGGRVHGAIVVAATPRTVDPQ